MSAPTEKKTKKQLNQEALNASVDSNWEEALRINDELLERFPNDAEAMNRKGRAYIELRKLTEAREAYTEALKADPANMIARRNLQRLELLYNRAEGSPDGVGETSSIIPRTAVFIEENGRTWIDELARPAELGKLAEVSPGDELALTVEDGRVIVRDDDDSELGHIDLQTGARIIGAINGGHTFEVYALGMSGHSLRVIIREVSRPEDSAGDLTFPRQDHHSQDLLRERQQLSLRDEQDFDFGDDEELGDDRLEDVDDDDEELDERSDDEDPASLLNESAFEDEESDEM